MIRQMVSGINFHRVVLEYCKELVLLWVGIRGSSPYPVGKKRIERVNKVLYISFRGSTTRKVSPAVV